MRLCPRTFRGQQRWAPCLCHSWGFCTQNISRDKPVDLVPGHLSLTHTLHLLRRMMWTHILVEMDRDADELTHATPALTRGHTHTHSIQFSLTSACGAGHAKQDECLLTV